MHLVTEFRRYAQESCHMADMSRNRQDQDQWRQLGERWLRCAEYLEREDAALGKDRPRGESAPIGGRPRSTGRIKGPPQKAA